MECRTSSYARRRKKPRSPRAPGQNTHAAVRAMRESTRTGKGRPRTEARQVGRPHGQLGFLGLASHRLPALPRRRLLEEFSKIAERLLAWDVSLEAQAVHPRQQVLSGRRPVAADPGRRVVDPRPRLLPLGVEA